MDELREKLEKYGPNSLSDYELVMIITGSKEKTSKIFPLGTSIFDMTKLTDQQFRNAGLTKYQTNVMRAVIEFGKRRYAQSDQRYSTTIRGSQDAFRELRGRYEDLNIEEFHIILVNRANKIICKKKISSGGTAGTVVDSKIVFKQALEHSAAGIILSHNHPSGSLNPSQADIDLTKKLKEGAMLLDISVLDHLIIHGSTYFSFADEGLL